MIICGELVGIILGVKTTMLAYVLIYANMLIGKRFGLLSEYRDLRTLFTVCFGI